jgi:AbrB family looped-hinge helix DNA binding protein
MTAIVSGKGQVTIPKAIRDKLGLAPGTVLEFETVNCKIIGTKMMKDNVFRQWRGRGTGVVKRMGGVDAYLRGTRGR